jgi:phage terminase small subunit
MTEGEYTAPDSPKHLHSTGARFWTECCCEWELEDKDDLEVLRLTCEALDRAAQARRILRDKGLTFEDRFGRPSERPELRIERQSRAAAASLIKQIQQSKMAFERLELAVKQSGERSRLATEPPRRSGGGTRRNG